MIIPLNFQMIAEADLHVKILYQTSESPVKYNFSWVIEEFTET